MFGSFVWSLQLSFIWVMIYGRYSIDEFVVRVGKVMKALASFNLTQTGFESAR